VRNVRLALLFSVVSGVWAGAIHIAGFFRVVGPRDLLEPGLLLIAPAVVFLQNKPAMSVVFQRLPGRYRIAQYSTAALVVAYQMGGAALELFGAGSDRNFIRYQTFSASLLGLATLFCIGFWQLMRTGSFADKQ
jgi:hypothetical protein